MQREEGNGRVATGGLQMDQVNHVPLNAADLTSEVLEGATIYGTDDHKVETLDHIHGTNPSGKAVIDVGGFLRKMPEHRD